MHLLPELDVEQWCITEVSQTLDVDDLLHLSTSFYERLHWFRLNIELWDQLRRKTNNKHTLIMYTTKITMCVSKNEHEFS